MDVDAAVPTTDGESPSEKNTRLMIKEVVLENFKSYAGVKRVGPFDKRFTSVVGPNGNGKSNVLDAILFVFGKRAKKLRQNKVSGLIHASQGRTNIQYAKVSVHFQEIIDKEGSSYDVVPGSNFVITRAADKSNRSEYFVNDVPATFSEATELVKSKGVDLNNNRFLILQGEVEMISQMKPKGADKNETGFLEYLEDIIGSDKYVEQLEELYKQLEEVDDNKQGLRQRLQALEKSKDALAGSKRVAERFLAKEAEVQVCKIKKCMHGLQKHKNKEAVLLEKLKEVEEKLKAEQEKLAQFANAKNESKKQCDDQLMVVQKLSKVLQKACAKFTKMEKMDVKFQTENKQIQEALQKWDGERQKTESNLQTAHDEIGQVEAELPQLQQQIEAMTNDLQIQEQRLEQMRDGIKSELEGYNRQLMEVRTALGPYERKIQEIESKIKNAQCEGEALVKKQQDAQNRFNEAQQQIEESKKIIEEKRQQVAELDRELENRRQQLAEAQCVVNSSQREEGQIERVLNEARSRVSHRRAEIESLKGQSHKMRLLAQAKQSGQISGIYGRLGDLGSIDARYDIAISSYCWALDFIVVETLEDAEKSAQLLREHQVGVSKFLVRSKQEHFKQAMNAQVQTPEGVPRLIDLIQVADERLKVAFYYGLRETVVAENLDQATRIAYETNFRTVVTLAGDIISDSGTMTGGGGKPRSGRICVGNSPPAIVDSNEAARGLEQAEREVETCTHDFSQFQQRREQANAAVQKLQREIQELEKASQQTKMEAEMNTAKSNDLNRRLARLERAAQPTQEVASRIQTLEREVVHGQQEIENVKNQCTGLTGQLAHFQSCIDNAGGEPMQKQKEAVEKLNKGIKSGEAEFAKKGALMENRKKQVSKLEKKLEQRHTEKEQMVEKRKVLESDIAELEAQAEQVLAKKMRAEQALQPEEQKLATLREELESRSKESAAVREVDAALQLEKNALNQRTREEQAVTSGLQNEIERHKARIEEASPGTPIPELTEEAILGLNLNELDFKINKLSSEMNEMNPDMAALEEYRRLESDYNSKCDELNVLITTGQEVKSNFDSTKKRRLDEFLAGFTIINRKLKEVYRTLTFGGDVELEAYDPIDPFADGVEFTVRPPKKSWKKISNLSGGEKTLSSLAFIFALHYYKPMPLYIMDEIDAALDFKNVSIVGNYIKERTKNTQFVIISQRMQMIELADMLVGIYKVRNCSLCCPMNPNLFKVGNANQSATSRENRHHNGQLNGNHNGTHNGLNGNHNGHHNGLNGNHNGHHNGQLNGTHNGLNAHHNGTHNGLNGHQHEEEVEVDVEMD